MICRNVLVLLLRFLLRLNISSPQAYRDSFAARLMAFSCSLNSAGISPSNFRGASHVIIPSLLQRYLEYPTASSTGNLGAP